MPRPNYRRAQGQDDSLEAARQFAPLDPSKNKDYGPPYKNEYNWDPENRGKGKCFYETGDEADRCYVTTNGGPGGQTKPSSGKAKNRHEYNKKYRKQRLKKKGDTMLRHDLIRVAYENPGPVRDAILPLLTRDSLRDAILPLLTRTAGIELPGMDVRSITQLRRVVDDPTYKLLREIYRTLQGRFSKNDEMAMNRILGSINAGSSWSMELHRNNIFKAADLLGLKLPHAFF